MKLAKPFWALLSFCAVSAQNQAVDSTTVSTNYLDEVVVTDSRFALKRSQSGKTVVKIKQEEIQQFSGLGLGVLLSTHLGIDVIGKNLYSGQNTTISIRGGRNRQVLILIDGVRVSDPSRIESDFDINALSIEMIESIEIVKGAASSLYGSSAATGVINITTKKPTESLSLMAKKTWGTELSANQALNSVSAGNHMVRLSSTQSGVGINLAYSERYSDGMTSVIGNESNPSIPDPFNKVNFNVGLSGQLTPKFNWKLGWNKDEIKADYDNGFPLEQADFRYTTETNRYVLSTKYNYTDGSLNLNAGYQDNKRDFVSSFPLNYESDNWNIDLFNKYIFNNVLYTIVGFQYQKATMEVDYNPEATQSDVYVNFVYLDPSGLNFNAGMRYNYHNAYDGHWTYSLNPSYSFTIDSDRQMKLFGSYSKAFIAPSLYKLYNPSYGNNDLMPENNISFEFGAEIRSGQNVFSAVYFNRKEDPTLIFGPPVPDEGYPYGRYANSDKEIVYRGVELAYDFELFKKVKSRLNYIFTETTDGDLRSIPKHAINGVMDFPLSDQTHLNLLGQYSGERIANDSKTLLEANSLFTLQLNHRLKKPNVNVFLSVYNLFDTEYVIIPQYATRGRNILAGISIQL
ncbi:MAG: TonB-dependent receptor [Flavobacteriaceae bacterium]|nr:TonB-dependent receptor [Flavobacteriaceae bacterium]MDG1941725.1 TonB-dependent receptor [Flavobacteriaceae bacterium]